MQKSHKIIPLTYVWEYKIISTNWNWGPSFFFNLWRTLTAWYSETDTPLVTIRYQFLDRNLKFRPMYFFTTRYFGIGDHPDWFVFCGTFGTFYKFLPWLYIWVNNNDLMAVIYRFEYFIKDSLSQKYQGLRVISYSIHYAGQQCGVWYFILFDVVMLENYIVAQIFMFLFKVTILCVGFWTYCFRGTSL